MTERDITIGIKSRTEPRMYEKAHLKWFNIYDFSDTKYICWKEELYDQLNLGQSPKVRIVEEPGKTPKIVAIITQKETTSKPSETKDKEKPSSAPKTEPHGGFKPSSPEQRRDKSVVLSYAKDLAVAKIIEPDKILEWANTFYKWLKEE